MRGGVMDSESLWVVVSEGGWRHPDPVTFESQEWQAVWQQGTSPVLAQEQFDQDIIADLGNAFAYFIESGQVWALIVGFVLGYMLRSVTTYR
jgi:hypothetical protein